MQICNDDMKCSGCGLCATVCPKACIEMRPNSEGFLYPHIDDSKCISCYKCAKNCPINNANLQKSRYSNRKCYAFQNQDRVVLQDSSSGGFFTAAARCILNEGGVVYAAAMEGLSTIKHVRITTESELAIARKSKYIQSPAWIVYNNVLADLKAEKEVLFIGTPCQVAAIKTLSSSDKLFTIDLVCHGVANEKILLKYLQTIKKKYSKGINKVYFRHKMNVGGNNENHI